MRPLLPSRIDRVAAAVLHDGSAAAAPLTLSGCVLAAACSANASPLNAASRSDDGPADPSSFGRQVQQRSESRIRGGRSASGSCVVGRRCSDPRHGDAGTLAGSRRDDLSVRAGAFLCFLPGLGQAGASIGRASAMSEGEAGSSPAMIAR